MQSRTARNLAVMMLLVAVALGLLAMRLVRDLNAPAESHVVVDVRDDLPRVVVATTRIEEGRRVDAESLSLEAVSVVPEGALRSVEEAVDREVDVAVGQGEPLLARHFRPPGPVASRVAPGERAVAVMVDDVIGLGGFIQPDDRVDVLLYLAKDQEVAGSEARVLLENIRVIAYGANLERREVNPSDGDPARARTAVLAVSEEDADRLMLGASKGRLRLALRGDPGDEDPTAASASPSSKDRVETLATLVRRNVASSGLGQAGPSPAPRRSVKVSRGERAEIDRY
jgi:pilus assembly protein CpaB